MFNNKLFSMNLVRSQQFESFRPPKDKARRASWRSLCTIRYTAAENNLADKVSKCLN